jgi:hypothetical protein
MLDFNEILDRIDYWLDKEKKWDGAFKQLTDVIAPSSYGLIVETDFAEAFIDGIISVRDWLKEDLSYYAYEMPYMDGSAKILYQGKEYDAKKRDEFVEYLKMLEKDNEN